MSTTYTIPINQTYATNITLTGSGSGGTHGPIYTAASTWTNPGTGTIQIKGDAVFEGNITWKGRDMREWFETVEARLAMLQPNPELEKDWEELAELGQKYLELERKLLEKQLVFDILNKK